MSAMVTKEQIELVVRGKLTNYIITTQLGCLRRVLVIQGNQGTKVSIILFVCRVCYREIIISVCLPLTGQDLSAAGHLLANCCRVKPISYSH